MTMHEISSFAEKKTGLPPAKGEKTVLATDWKRLA
jgi:hypothetical protein